MTEQEAFNNPEMKTILLLSGYVRELSEGADYETTTYKLAETLVKVFSISHVSQRSELLKAYYKITTKDKIEVFNAVSYGQAELIFAKHGNPKDIIKIEVDINDIDSDGIH